MSHDGKGIEGKVDGISLRLGSRGWLDIPGERENRFTTVFVQIGNEVPGYFEIKNKYREHILQEMESLGERYDLHLLSGDNEAERQVLQPVFSRESNLNFNQLPEQKTAYIKALQEKGRTVMMVGDGLNDANAFEQSDAGVAVIEHENNFLPACDVILLSSTIGQMGNILNYVRHSKTILFITFSVSLLYNIIGLSFAMRGELTPVVAAILMPISTVSVVGLSYLLSRYFAKRSKLKT
jgi:Cu+-exporting ATPase